MNPITFEQLVALVGFAGGVVAIVSTTVGMHRSGKQETAAQVEARTRTDAKLDSLFDQMQQQRDTLNRIDQKMDDHGQRIDKLEAKFEHMSEETYHRLERVEGRMDHMDNKFRAISEND